MATKLVTAILEIHVTVGNPYVRNDYVALDYVEGGIVAQHLDLIQKHFKVFLLKRMISRIPLSEPLSLV